MSDKYRLVGHDAVPCEDVSEWARCFEQDNRSVDETMVDDLRVSTVFLGLDHRFVGDGPALIFETMVFGSDGFDELICERCSTWDQAVAQHARIVGEIKRK